MIGERKGSMIIEINGNKIEVFLAPFLQGYRPYARFVKKVKGKWVGIRHKDKKSKKYKKTIHNKLLTKREKKLNRFRKFYKINLRG